MKGISVAVSVIILITGIMLSGCGLDDISTVSSVESRAKGTLRSLGSSMLAFQSTTGDGSYGTFEELQEDMYIADGYNLDNMIEYYTITWTVNNTPVDEDEPGINEFTIIAYPVNDEGRLRTLAVTEDQVVRVFNPEQDNDPDDVKTWEPIL